MKNLIYEATNVGSYDDDDYYYLVTDENDGSTYIEHKWHHWRPSGVDQGTEKLTLAQLKRKSLQAYYAAIAATAKPFSE